MLIAHITDTHFLEDTTKLADQFETGAAFERLIDSLRNQPVTPDLILFSGDLGERATNAEYAAIAAGLRPLGIAVRAVPGNHDKRAPMLEELPDMVAATKDGHLCILETGFDLRIIGLDTIVEGHPHGALCPQRLAWLDATLSGLSDQPVLMFMHHPPIKTGLRAMDDISLIEGGPELAEILLRHAKVQAILCGHMHRAIQGVFAGVPVRVAPSASHQIAFDLRTDQPYRLVNEPGQYMMHVWNRENGLISHTVPVTNAN